MQEGISYLAACELPAVIANVMRGGPGLGNIAPAQSDYFQAVKGGGHGDYRLIVYAPSTVQEVVDYTYKSFLTLSDKPAQDLMTKHYGERWSIEEFFNFDGAIGFDKAGTQK